MKSCITYLKPNAWYGTSHFQKQHFLRSQAFTFLWKYSVCGLKFEISEYPIKPLQYTPPRPCVLRPKIWRYRTSLKNPGTGAETHKWNFSVPVLGGFCRIFYRRQIKGTVRPYTFKNVRPWGGILYWIWAHLKLVRIVQNFLTEICSKISASILTEFGRM